jgi:hypothetical protein
MENIQKKFIVRFIKTDDLLARLNKILRVHMQIMSVANDHCLSCTELKFLVLS